MQNNFCKLFIAIFLFFILFIQFSLGQVLLNEIMPNNSSNSSGDWVEIYNSGNLTIQINNWYLQDFAGNRKIIENFLFSPFSYKVIYFSNRLDNGGDTVYLFNDQNTTMDLYSYSSSTPDFSFSRCPDGNNNWIITIPTPGSTNNCSQQNNQTNQTNSTQGSPEISFSYPPEVYNNKTNFTIQILFENFSVGNYDIKIDIKDNLTYLNRFWTIDGWSSKNSWIENFVSISSNQQKIATINIIDVDNSFSGNATIQIKLRNSTNTYLSEIKQINILNGTTNQNFTNNTNQNEESKIEIIDYPDSADFGDEIEVIFNVYKGDTSKYAVYVYVQDEEEEKVSEKITVHAGNSSTSSKFKNYYFEEEILLDCLSDSGDYELIIEGLDIIETKEIEIDKCSEAGEQTNNSKTEYIIQNPEKIRLGEKITIPVKIINNEDIEKTFLIWSYVYNGPKCYSCIDNREENSQQITVQPFSEEIVYLENQLLSAGGGEYNLKIKILREGLKTPKEFTYPIYLEGQDPSSNNLEYGETITGNVLQSKQNYFGEMRSKKSIFLEAIPYLVATLSMLFCIYLVVRKM